MNNFYFNLRVYLRFSLLIYVFILLKNDLKNMCLLKNMFAKNYGGIIWRGIFMASKNMAGIIWRFFEKSAIFFPGIILPATIKPALFIPGKVNYKEQGHEVPSPLAGFTFNRMCTLPSM